MRYSCDTHKRAQVGLWASSAFISFLVPAVSPSLAILSDVFASFTFQSPPPEFCLSLVSGKPVLITLS